MKKVGAFAKSSLDCRKGFHQLYGLSTAQPEGNGDSLVNGVHQSVVKVSHLFAQALFINGTYLFKKNDGVSRKAYVASENVYMSGKTGFPLLAGYGGGYDRWTVTVSHVVLDYENGTEPALLAAHNGTEIRIKNITAQYFHNISLSVFCDFLCVFSISICEGVLVTQKKKDFPISVYSYRFKGIENAVVDKSTFEVYNK